jgi:hypothetical protein
MDAGQLGRIQSPYEVTAPQMGESAGSVAAGFREYVLQCTQSRRNYL